YKPASAATHAVTTGAACHWVSTACQPNGGSMRLLSAASLPIRPRHAPCRMSVSCVSPRWSAASTARSRRRLAGYEKLGSDAWVTFAGHIVEAADEAQTGRHRPSIPCFGVARRVRLVADGGGLENR